MKVHRIELTGTGPTADFIVRIPSATVYDAQIFVEMLSIDTGGDSTTAINHFHVKSKTLTDGNSYSSQSSNYNSIAQLANNISVNTNKDFRFSQTVDETAIGYPLRMANFSNYPLNITIQQDNNTDITGAWTWSLLLLVVDGKDKNNLVSHDKNQSSYLNNTNGLIKDVLLRY